MASSCLDRTVKMWLLGTSTPNLTLEAHEKGGVYYVDFYPGTGKPYLVTSGDNRAIKIRDYLSKAVYRRWRDTPTTCCLPSSTQAFP